MAKKISKKKSKLNKKNQDIFGLKKAWLHGKAALTKLATPLPERGLLFEALEPRVLMSADLSFGAAATDLTLHFDAATHDYQLLSVDANGQNGVQSTINANQITNGNLTIIGNNKGDTLRLDASLQQAITINFQDTNAHDQCGGRLFDHRSHACDV